MRLESRQTWNVPHPTTLILFNQTYNEVLLQLFIYLYKDQIHRHNSFDPTAPTFRRVSSLY